ncbi:MAG: hypothetical protein C4589_09375 [Peptococcaceae bacterium]|nr:MAG: hypothetical protein C4589_09375 [Peptococcaceae bacterium]
MEDIIKRLSDLLPGLKTAKASKKSEPGCGWVSKSLFVAEDNRIFWVVLLTEPATFAFLEVSPLWVQYFAELVLESPHIFVCWNSTHKIDFWVAAQEKTELAM